MQHQTVPSGFKAALGVVKASLKQWQLTRINDKGLSVYYGSTAAGAELKIYALRISPIMDSEAAEGSFLLVSN